MESLFATVAKSRNVWSTQALTIFAGAHLAARHVAKQLGCHFEFLQNSAISEWFYYIIPGVEPRSSPGSISENFWMKNWVLISSGIEKLRTRVAFRRALQPRFYRRCIIAFIGSNMYPRLKYIPHRSHSRWADINRKDWNIDTCLKKWSLTEE